MARSNVVLRCTSSRLAVHRQSPCAVGGQKDAGGGGGIEMSTRAVACNVHQEWTIICKNMIERYLRLLVRKYREHYPHSSATASLLPPLLLVGSDRAAQVDGLGHAFKAVPRPQAVQRFCYHGQYCIPQKGANVRSSS